MSDAPVSHKQPVAVVTVERVATALQVLGIACVVAAAFAFDWRAGLAVIGLLCVLGSLALAPARGPADGGER